MAVPLPRVRPARSTPGRTEPAAPYGVGVTEPRTDLGPDVSAGGRPGFADLRAAALGDRPGLDVTGWTRPVGELGWAEWTAGVVLGGQGRYAAATDVFRRLARHRDPVLRAHALIALASHRRQLGGHALARTYDGAALHALATVGDPKPDTRTVTAPAGFVADGVDLAGARADALLGLAADALGLGRLAEARQLRGLAVPDAATASWRTLVRADWIAAEIALGSGNPEEAIGHAESAGHRSQGAGSLRHAIKSDLVRSAGLATAATAQAIPTLHSVVEQAMEFCLFPLLWPTALLLAELDQGSAAKWTDLGRKALVRVLEQADPETIRCALASPWVPWSVVRSGDVDGLRARSKIFTD